MLTHKKKEKKEKKTAEKTQSKVKIELFILEKHNKYFNANLSPHQEVSIIAKTVFARK